MEKEKPKTKGNRDFQMSQVKTGIVTPSWPALGNKKDRTTSSSSLPDNLLSYQETSGSSEMMLLIIMQEWQVHIELFLSRQGCVSNVSVKFCIISHLYTSSHASYSI